LIKSRTNVPIEFERNVPIARLVQDSHHRRYVRLEQIEFIAIEKSKKNWKDGITFRDLISNRLARSKEQAQRMLKHCCHVRKLLFSLENRKPQVYYPSRLRAQIIENMKKNNENILIDLTEVSHSKAPLPKESDRQKADSFFEVLNSIGSGSPLFVHKIGIYLLIVPSALDGIHLGESANHNRAKQHEEHVGKAVVKYIIYPNGRIMIHIVCSNNPFKLETESDESSLFSLLDQVRDRLLGLFRDPHERIIPQILEWNLIGCDINKDIAVTDKTQLTGQNIQVKEADRVFRLYIKSLGNKAVYRAEESVTLHQALRSVRNPNDVFTKDIKEIKDEMKCLATAVYVFTRNASIVAN
jgi:hypothetical protein